MIKLIAPKNGAQISILTDVQREFIRREREGITKSSESYGWISHDMASGRNLSYPAAVMFQWSCDDPTSKMNFEISLNSDFIESESRRGKIASVGMARASAGENGLYFLIADNLLSGETYYWRVNEGDGKGETFTFTTAPGETRFIRADGGSNIRDLGGKTTVNGRRVKQGLVYRGGTIESKVGVQYELTDEGKRVMREDLGIKTEIDLRDEAIGVQTKSVIGDNVEYKIMPMIAYGGGMTDDDRAAVRRILELFADDSVFPVYFHCLAGADRTGTIGYLLGVLLELQWVDVALDFNATTLSVINKRHIIEDSLGPQGFFESLRGASTDKSLTHAELLKSYFNSLGIPAETIDKIRANLIE